VKLVTDIIVKDVEYVDLREEDSTFKDYAINISPREAIIVEGVEHQIKSIYKFKKEIGFYIDEDYFENPYNTEMCIAYTPKVLEFLKLPIENLITRYEQLLKTAQKTIATQERDMNELHDHMQSLDSRIQLLSRETLKAHLVRLLKKRFL